MMLKTSYIDFSDYYNNLHYSKSDSLEDVIIKKNLDIIFITNYINHSFDFDVVCILDNVFYNELETKYNIYKGSIKNKMCNIIIIKKNLGKFELCFESFDEEFKIKPLILKNKLYTLMCIDFTNTNFIGKHNTLIYKSTVIKYLQKATNIIVGGIFEFNLKYLYKFINFNINSIQHNFKYGIYCKNMKTIENDISIVKYFRKNLVLCNCQFIEYDEQHKNNINEEYEDTPKKIYYYLNKIKSLFI